VFDDSLLVTFDHVWILFLYIFDCCAPVFKVANNVKIEVSFFLKRRTVNNMVEKVLQNACRHKASGYKEEDSREKRLRSRRDDDQENPVKKR
jgi:hypothetical protein